MAVNAVNGAALLTSPLFRGIPAEKVTEIVRLFERRRCPPETVIVREGDPGDALFIVETGLVEVFLQSATGETTVLTRLGPGEAFGEMSVLTGERRSAGVRTMVNTVDRVVPREGFLQAAAETPLLLFNLSRVLVGRLSRANQQASDQRGSEVVAIIGRLPPLIGSLVATNVAAAVSSTTRQRVLLVDRPEGQACTLPGRDRTPALTDIWTRSESRLRVPAPSFGAARFMAVGLPPNGGLMEGIQPLSLSEALGWFRQNARFTILNLVGEDRGDVLSILPHVDRTYLLVTTAQLSTTFADELVSGFFALQPDVRQRAFPILLSDEGLSLTAVKARSVERLGVPVG